MDDQRSTPAAPVPENAEPTVRMGLSQFLRDHQDDIIADWTLRVRTISTARELSDAAIADHLPAILSRIATLVEPPMTAASSSLGRLSEAHAIDRLDRGFDLNQIVSEYGFVRQSILDLWEKRVGPTIDVKEVRALDIAFDEALRRATVRHADTRHKLLKALDQISVAALGSADLDSLLQRLLRATLESTESVDAAIVLLREGDTLRLRSAVGLEQNLQQALSISKREGIAGQVAADAQPIFIRDAANDARVKIDALRDKGVRALYVVPLIHNDDVIGVVHFGSLTAFEFSDENKLLFRAMASRATSVIVQAQLVAQLRLSEETFRLAIEAAPAAMIIVNRAGVITLVNSLTERMLGYERPELIGRPVDDFVPHRFRATHSEFTAKFFDNVSRRPMGAGLELFMLTKNGSEVPVEMSLSSFESDRDVFVLAAVTDITERKRAEDERTQLLHREQAARRDVEHASRLKDEFLATLSHELRTPLNAILGYSRMLRSRAMPPQRAPRALEIIERNATALTQIVADVLDVSRIISGKLRLSLQPVDMRTLVRHTIDTVRPAADAKRMALQVQLDSDVMPVSGDPDRLQQVVWNLLSNAVKFTPEGGRIHVQVEETDGHVDVVVSDTGIGIASEFLPHMFERFRQADGGTTRAHGGLGLGLATARHLVELHGGTINGMSPGPAQGATFRVRLPVTGAQVESMPIARRPVHSEQPALRRPVESSLQGFHILAVDDDDDALTLVHEILEAAGAHVSSARSGADALKQIQHLKPDLLVADLGLPLMDGFEMIRRVRQLPDRSVSGIAAIALTAYATSEDRVKALESGFQLHIAKPLDPQELVNAVTALLGRPDPH